MKIGIYLAAGIAALSVAACTPKTTGTPETNPALETIFSRTSIRTYQDRTVEPQKIELLLRAAMSAPSGKDQRPWEFVVVNERPILDSLAAALPCRIAPRCRRSLRPKLYLCQFGEGV